MTTNDFYQEGQKLKWTLRRNGMDFYRVQRFCMRLLDNIKRKKTPLEEIINMYLLVSKPVPPELSQANEQELYSFIGGLVPGKEEWELIK